METYFNPWWILILIVIAAFFAIFAGIWMLTNKNDEDDET